MANSLIIASGADGVGTITLNRPQALNAWNLDMAQQFLRAMAQLGRNDAVRAIVLRGNGKVFSAGGDVRAMLGDVRRGEDPAAYFRAPLAAFGEMVLAVRKVPKPVLAAVHGAVAGFAFNLMLGCDLKIATETTRFTQAFIKLGLSPDGGGTWFLPRLVGYARACELALLPTELDARTARDWGLINWVVAEEDFEEQVRNTAGRLARGPARAMAQAKALLHSAFDRDLARQIEAERLAQVENAASPDFAEGLTAFLEKRPPVFGT
jgi:2-(1,2-epoxy-1,2-dihydrophenyl)acetyl-CoA isomerase